MADKITLPHPDAVLMQLGKEWHAAYEHAEACPGTEYEAAMAKRVRIEDQILATPARGVAGLSVKASMVERFGLGDASYIAQNLVDDVLRLARQSA